MNQTSFERLARLVQQCDRSVILRAAAVCNGHSIFSPQVFLSAGLPEAIVRRFTRTHRSNPASPKGTLFVGGRPVTRLSGVDGLELLEFLAQALGVTCPPALGRGTRARRIQDALARHFEKIPPEDPSPGAEPTEVAGSTPIAKGSAAPDRAEQM